jgi:predicted acetyltransferase
MGRESHEILPYITTQTLAQKFNKTMLDVPGGHVGYTVYPEQLSNELHEELKKLGHR